MLTREVPREEWVAFFDSFSRQHEGWRVNLEVFGADIGAQVEGRDLVFEGITAELGRVGEDAIEIMVGERAEAHITHRIASPRKTNIEQTDEGADAALAIKAADGVTTLLRFRSAVLPDTVDGAVL